MMDCITASYVNGSKTGQSRESFFSPIWSDTHDSLPIAICHLSALHISSSEQSSLPLLCYGAASLPSLRLCSPRPHPTSSLLLGPEAQPAGAVLAQGPAQKHPLCDKQTDTVTHGLRTAASAFEKGGGSFGGRRMLSPPAVSFISSAVSCAHITYQEIGEKTAS